LIICAFLTKIILKILSDCFDEANSSIRDAVKLFSKRRARESKVLVQWSRDFDRPGILGTFTFIIPIILDSIFHRLAPNLFAPNSISMLQRQDITFQQGRRRKRLDRAFQLCVISGSIFGIRWATNRMLDALKAWSGKRKSTIIATLSICAAASVILKKSVSNMTSGKLEAKVFANSEDKITAGESFIAEYKPHKHETKKEKNI